MDGIILSDYEEGIDSIDINNDNALIFTTCSNDGEHYYRRVIIYDLRRNKLKAEKVFDSEEFIDEYRAEFIDDKSFALCNVNDKKADTYNFNMKLLEKGINYDPKPDYYDVDYFDQKRNNNPLIEETYAIYHTFATDIIGENRAVVFYDDAVNFYIQKYDDNESIIDSVDKKILTCNETRDSLTFQMKDYLTSTIINSAKIVLSEPTDDDFTRIPYTAGLNEKYIIVPIIGNNGMIEDIYYWDYTLKQTNQPFDSGKINYKDIDRYISNAQKDLEEKYEIDFKINPENIDDDKPLIKEENKLKLYLSLLFIDETFDMFPKGMIKEMYDYENGFDSMCVYICKKIDDDFSVAYSANINGENYIVYSTSFLSKGTIAHELMHAAEYRIWGVCGDKYDDQWEKLNPSDFYYVGYDSYSDYEKYEDIDRYFARDYGRSTQGEDKAVTFEALFCFGIDDMTVEWDNNSPVFKKGKLICEALRESYPSVKNSDNVVWEKYITDNQ